MPTCFRLLLAFALLSITSVAQSPLANPSFEEGTATLPGWIAGNPANYSASLTAESCTAGKQCAVLRSTATPAPNGFGTLMQSFDATPYRGKKFRFKAAVRTQVAGTGNQARLSLRVEREAGGMGFVDNMGDRPITSSTWTSYEITGDVDKDAKSIYLGLLLFGAGSAWIDDVSFTIVGDADPVEPARPLTSRGLQNIQALARLFGYIRYFHPSDEAFAADWNRVAVEAVRTVESAQTPAELAAKLQSVFGPLAPSVQIFPTGSTPVPIDLKPLPYATSWRHFGVSQSSRSIYHSDRVTAEAVESPPPLRVELPGGVSCVIPTVLYRSSPRPSEPAPILTKPVGSGNDRAIRLAAVIVAWNVFQHFFPYFDVVHTDWIPVLPAALSQAAQDQDASAFTDTLRRMVAALHDGHGGVMGPSSGNFVPAIRWTWAEGRIVALSVKDVAGIQPGDALVTIDGKPAAETLAAREALISGATPQYIRYVALGSLLARDRGTNVQLEIESVGQPGTRRSVSVQCTVRGPLEESRPDKIQELEPGIIYVDLNRITGADFAAALPSLSKATGIVFDMRGYPGKIGPGELFGHLIDKPVTSAQWHVPVVTKPDHVDMSFERSGEWTLKPIAPYLTAKRAFLTDGRAISYAESCMGIVEHYKLAEIVGEPTAGTNGNINPFMVPGGYQLSWTGMKVLKHDGSQHHGVGIQPTIPVSLTRAGIAAGRDEILERAVLAVKQ
jgi:C-terminal processing protease CtpA/Prc